MLYFFFAVCSFFSTAIVRKIGSERVAMSIGAFCYSFWLVCFLLPCYYQKYEEKHGSMKGAPGILNRELIQSLLLITGAILGIGAGILWVAQGKFISECACQEN